MKIDMHVHTEFSEDSNTPVEKVVEKAEREGLDGVAVTDHDTMEGVEKMRELDHDLVIVPGMEITTDEGELLGLFIEEEIKSKNPETVIEEVRKQGGLVIVPHPFDPIRGFEGWQDLEVDGIEVINSRNLMKGMNKKARRYVDREGVMKTGGSDAHTAWEIGKAWTEAQAETLGEFKRKLEEGEVDVSGVRSSPLSYILGNLEKARNFLSGILEDREW